jgi:hypothetical protein
MTPSQKELFTLYEEYKRGIAELEEKCEAIKPALLELIPEGSKIDSGTGIFTLSSRKTWKYSDELTELEKEVKDKKKTEEQTGIATAEEGTPFIIFKAKKE